MSCPICQKPTDKAYRPFCSKRCADIDLAKWLNEDYTVPAREEDPFS
ncbi:DNA gyrase inhibitor YacG, partial [Cognatishimia sp.]